MGVWVWDGGCEGWLEITLKHALTVQLSIHYLAIITTNCHYQHHSVNQSITQSINQSTNQSINQSINQWISQWIIGLTRSYTFFHACNLTISCLLPTGCPSFNKLKPLNLQRCVNVLRFQIKKKRIVVNRGEFSWWIVAPQNTVAHMPKWFFKSLGFWIKLGVISLEFFWDKLQNFVLRVDRFSRYPFPACHDWEASVRGADACLWRREMDVGERGGEDVDVRLHHGNHVACAARFHCLLQEIHWKTWIMVFLEFKQELGIVARCWGVLTG